MVILAPRMEETEFLNDDYFMRIALSEAKIAFDEDEIPIGAVIVANKTVIAKAHNMTQRLNDVTAHAEMLAFTAASEYLQAKYLIDCTLYVTIEPCPMCAGAAYWTQVSRIVFGAPDIKRGYQTLQSSILHPTTTIKKNVLTDECSELMKKYFKGKR